MIHNKSVFGAIFVKLILRIPKFIVNCYDVCSYDVRITKFNFNCCLTLSKLRRVE